MGTRISGERPKVMNIGELADDWKVRWKTAMQGGVRCLSQTGKGSHCVPNVNMKAV